MGANSVRQAQHWEAIGILQSDGVCERLDIYPKEIKKGDCYIVNNRLLLILMPHDSRNVEAHIAQSKSNWKHIHEDIDDSLTFIESMGYNNVYTNVNRKLKTTLNLLRKHGFVALDEQDEEVILVWVSQQH